jgi:lipoic acid synthetase
MTKTEVECSRVLNVVDLGLEPYDRVLDLQHRLVRARKHGLVADTLILVEHPPVITIGRRGNESNILASRDWLARHGIQVCGVERGGDVTYHGPGQLVGYPIMNLRQHRQDVGWYMHSLEEVLIRTLQEYGLAAGRLAGYIGVWLKGQHKIAALGVRIEDWITYHGFALNVGPDLSHFELIVPCGLAGKEVTSMEKTLGQPVDMALVREQVSQSFSIVFGMELRETRLDDIVVEMEPQSAGGSRAANRAAL